MFTLKFIPSSALFVGVRTFSRTVPLRLKEIASVKTGNITYLEGKEVSSPREPFMLNIQDNEKKKACPICSLGLDVRHTDVLILSQFVRSDGCMLPRRITGLCKKQQKRIGVMVTMAHKAGLMSFMNPPGSKKDPKRRRDYKKYNTYFYEETIKTRP